jgi:hypothetical protein
LSEETDRTPDEVARVLRWRRSEALDAGLSWDEANEYAEAEIGAEELRHLIELGCPIAMWRSCLRRLGVVDRLTELGMG